MSPDSDDRSIRLTRDLPHPPAKVWRALTESDLLARWLMATDLVPAEGTRFTFRNEPKPWWDGVVDCEILEAIPPRRLRYTWKGGPPTIRVDTIVTWTLIPLPSGGTRLELEQSGFTPETPAAFAGAEQGWRRNLDRLAEALAALSSH